MAPSLDKVFDVAVIGGGLNGAAIARDCATRRLSVLLVEKDDLASGGSGANAGLLHGGPRYFEPAGETSLQETEEIEAIGRIAPNLMVRVPMLYPVMRGDSRADFDRIETLAHSAGKSSFRLGERELFELEPGLSREMLGAVSVEEWKLDPTRLTILTARSAAAAGAQILTRTRAEGIATQDKRVAGVNLSSRSLGRTLARARTVVNATGPWAPFLDPERTPQVKLRPSKGVYLVLDRRITSVALACPAVDGRDSVFLLPSNDVTLIGATDTDFFGDPDELAITQDDVGYLMETVRHYFPALPSYRVTHAFAGVRPTVHVWGVTPKEIPSRFQIFDHGENGIEGFYTVIGGKLSTHRLMAEQVTDLICRRLKAKDESKTKLESLPGCTSEMPWKEESRRTGIDPLTVKGLMRRHGYKALEILENARKQPELGRTLCECEQVIAAEVEYCVREEWATSLDDIARRTRLGTGACRSCRCAETTACFAGSLLGWNEEQVTAEAAAFLAMRRRETHPVIFGEQAQQEEYARALLLLSERGT